MDNAITLNRNKPQTFEFEMTVKGLDLNDVRVFMGIETKNVTLCYKCKQKDGDVWACDVPVTKDTLTKSEYPFYVAAVIGGQFFEPFRGTVNVSSGSEESKKEKPAVQVEKPKNASEEKKDEAKDEKKEEKRSDESVADVAKRLLTEDNTFELKADAEPLDIAKIVERAFSTVRRPVKEGTKDKDVKRILSETRKVPVKTAPKIAAKPTPVKRQVDEQHEKVKNILREAGIEPRKVFSIT